MALSSLRRWFSRSHTPTMDVTPRHAGPLGAEEQFLEGLKFAGGQGVDQDYAQAAHWYAQAAEQNHSLAQWHLAMLYGQGQGVVRNEAKSLLWLTRAAALGNAAAQYRLGIQQHLACREARTSAAPEARIEALKWVRLAAAQGYRDAETACQFVALGMTREEVAEGGRRAGAFVAAESEIRGITRMGNEGQHSIGVSTEANVSGNEGEEDGVDAHARSAAAASTGCAAATACRTSDGAATGTSSAHEEVIRSSAPAPVSAASLTGGRR